MIHELKINNLVNFFWQKDMPLELLRLCPAEFSVRVIDEECKRLYPIPLTHEILEGCGTVEGRCFYVMLPKEAVRFLMWSDYDGNWFYDNGNNKISVKYLHQLQNLYFALTGEELTVKLPVTA